MKIGDNVEVKGATGTVEAVKAGWATVAMPDGSKEKIRVPASKPKKASMGEKIAKATTKKAPAKKAPAKKAAAKKVPAKKAAAKKADGDEKLVKANLENYTVHDSKTPSGRRHLDIGDSVADKLREMKLEDIYRYASQLTEVPMAQLKRQYEKLNPGMQRMNLGNRIRGVYRLAEKTKTGFSKVRAAAAAAA